MTADKGCRSLLHKIQWNWDTLYTFGLNKKNQKLKLATGWVTDLRRQMFYHWVPHGMWDLKSYTGLKSPLRPPVIRILNFLCRQFFFTGGFSSNISKLTMTKPGCQQYRHQQIVNLCQHPCQKGEIPRMQHCIHPAANGGGNVVFRLLCNKSTNSVTCRASSYRNISKWSHHTTVTSELKQNCA